MKRLIGIGGPPGAGKSHLVQCALAALDRHRFVMQQEGTIQYLQHLRLPLIVLGSYAPGDATPGTDRLHLCVHPEAKRFLARHAAASADLCCLFEGDRFCNEPFLAAAAAWFDDVRLLLLDVPRAVRDRRCQTRGARQAETFLRGRETKYRNLARLSCAEVLPNFTAAHADALLERLLRLIELQ